jgi:small subunit ribosomal protein S19
MTIGKEFSFRGKTMEELKVLDIREFAKLLNARGRRSVTRQAEIITKFIKRCEKKETKSKPIRTHDRELIIVPKMVGMTIEIYSGKEFVPIKLIDEMLGHRLGEFVLTRKKVEHSAPGIGATRSSSFLSVK